jgi:hypothetical protein
MNEVFLGYGKIPAPCEGLVIQNKGEEKKQDSSNTKKEKEIEAAAARQVTSPIVEGGR